jgi:putative ABC transport system substrate-binding protein
MHRRAFLAASGAAAVVGPINSRAQNVRKIWRIGILSSGGSSAEIVGAEPRSRTVGAFLRGLRELGRIYGRDFVTVPLSAESRPELYPRLVAELVAHGPDVIVSAGPLLSTLKRANSTIPVVMAAAGDPVGTGFIQSLARPGANMTGLSLQSVETTGKRLELLRELVPGNDKIAVVWDRQSLAVWQAAQAAAQLRDWQLISFHIDETDEIDRLFAAAKAVNAGAAFLSAPTLLFGHIRRAPEAAARHELPTMYQLRNYVDEGGLVSYGADIVEVWRRAASFVDRIMKGAKAGELPVEQPVKFELVINAKVASTLGLAIPQTLLALADLVIE